MVLGIPLRTGSASILAISAFGFCATTAGALMIDFGPDVGGPVKGWAVLTDELATSGVSFSTPEGQGVYWWGGDYSWRPARYSISEGSVWDNPHGIHPIRMDFSPWVTEVSIRGFDGGGDTDVMILKAYGPGGQLVDSVEITSTFDSVGHVLTVSAPQITYATVQSIAPLSGLFFDDLSFTLAPEPTSGLLLLLLGCLAGGRLRRRPQ